MTLLEHTNTCVSVHLYVLRFVPFCQLSISFYIIKVMIKIICFVLATISDKRKDKYYLTGNVAISNELVQSRKRSEKFQSESFVLCAI